MSSVHGTCYSPRMNKPYFFEIDVWNNGQPLFNPEQQPASVRPIMGSDTVKVANNSGFPVRVSLRPSMSPTPQGSPSFVPVPPPEVDAILQPGQEVELDGPADLVQVWLDGAAPAAYAPVVISAS